MTRQTHNHQSEEQHSIALPQILACVLLAMWGCDYLWTHFQSHSLSVPPKSARQSEDFHVSSVSSIADESQIGRVDNTAANPDSDHLDGNERTASGTSIKPNIRVETPVASLARVKPQLVAKAASQRKTSSASSNRMMPYTTSQTQHQQCDRFLAQSRHELSVGAWHSAENSAWAALTLAVETLEPKNLSGPSRVGQPRVSPTSDLTEARVAVFEARDFVAVADDGQPAARVNISLAALVRSHQTKILRNSIKRHTTRTQAINAYLDFARRRFGRIATESIKAAEAMDLLAAVYLQRDDQKILPKATALCLRRAALHGQPHNATLAQRLGTQLASDGLLNEARLTLEHALTIENSLETQRTLAAVLREIGDEGSAQRIESALAQHQQTKQFANARVPEVIQLSPEEFAAISTPVMTASARISSEPIPPSVRPNLSSQPQTDIQNVQSDASASQLDRAVRSIQTLWR